MKKYYLLVLLSGIFSLGWTGSQEKKAFALLDSISKHKNFQATFVYYIQPDQEPSEEKFTGSITVQGTQYRLSMGGQAIISNGTTIWSYLPDANEVQINSSDPTQGSNTPWVFLTNYRQDYQFSSLSSFKKASRTYDKVELTAKDLENEMQRVVIAIERKTKQVKRIETLDKDKNQHIFSVTKFETDLTLGEEFFNFLPENYADIEVIDMREEEER